MPSCSTKLMCLKWRGPDLAVRCPGYHTGPLQRLLTGVGAMEERLIRKAEVCRMIGRSRATLDRYCNDFEYRHMGFPKPIRDGWMVFFVHSEVQEWIQNYIAAKRDTSE